MAERTLDSKRIYAELDTLKEEMRGLKQMVGEVVTRIHPTIQMEHPHIVRVEGIPCFNLAEFAKREWQ